MKKNNKKWIYVLAPACLIVWGLISYRIYDTIHADEPSESGSEIQPLISTTIEINSDTFSIKANYRDPFLDKAYVVQTKKKITTKAQEKHPPKEVIWPMIEFNGTFKSKEVSEVVAIIRINGREEFVRKGDEINGVELIAITEDKLVVEFQGEKRTISNLLMTK